MSTSTTAKSRRRPGLESVLVTADRLFYEGGIHATGVDLIAAEAGVSKATMYTYFATKDDLVAEYLRGRSEAWQTHVAEQLEAHEGGPLDRVLAVFDLLGGWFQSDDFNGCPFINAEAETTRDAPAHLENLKHRTWVRELFSNLLEEAGITDADLLARQLAVLYDGAITSANAEPGGGWAQAAREAAQVLITSAAHLPQATSVGN